jgi:hypothetical protein
MSKLGWLLKLVVVMRIEAINIKGLYNITNFLQIRRVTFHYVRHIHLHKRDFINTRTPYDCSTDFPDHNKLFIGIEDSYD